MPSESRLRQNSATATIRSVVTSPLSQTRGGRPQLTHSLDPVKDHQYFLLRRALSERIIEDLATLRARILQPKPIYVQHSPIVHQSFIKCSWQPTL